MISKEKKAKNKKIRGLIYIIITIVILCVIALLLNFNSNNEKEKTYNEAITLTDNKDYDASIEKFKSIIDFKDSKEQIKNTYYLYAKDEITKENYDIALNLLDNCKDYKDTNDLILETKYKYGIYLLNINGKDAISYLEQIKDYKDVNTIIEDYNKNHIFDGTYSDKHSSNLPFERRYIVNGLPTKIISYQYAYNETILSDNKYSTGYFNRYENELKCNEEYNICTNNSDDYDRTYYFYEDKIIVKVHNKKPSSWEKNYTDWEDTYYKISDSLELPEERTIIGSAKPKIGMTEQEVRNSSWGEPQKINKSTYSWGTTEQWVYGNNRYVYFRNGKVTSISESK